MVRSTLKRCSQITILQRRYNIDSREIFSIDVHLLLTAYICSKKQVSFENNTTDHLLQILSDEVQNCP